MSGRDDESCDIMRHHATSTSCDQERKRVRSRWRKMSFDRRRCGRETRRWERERKAGGSRKRKGFPLQKPSSSCSKQKETRRREVSPSLSCSKKERNTTRGRNPPCRICRCRRVDGWSTGLWASVGPPQLGWGGMLDRY